MFALACRRCLEQATYLLAHSPQPSVARYQCRTTTILCVRKGPDVVLMGDGMASIGSEIVKPNVNKLRLLRASVVAGFAGATADAFTLFERLEAKLEEH